MRKSRLGMVLILLILVGLAGGRAQPPPLPPPPFQRVTVCPEGPPKCDFTSIEAATGIVAGGGVIEVLPGVYTENIEIWKSLTLQGTTDVTIKAKDPEQSVIYVKPGVENVTITNLRIIESDESGIEIGEGARQITIKGNWIETEDAEWIIILSKERRGVGIKPRAQVVVEGNIFATLIGIVVDTARVDIIDNILIGIIVINGGEVKISRNKIFSGGISIEANSLTPVSVDIDNNLIHNTVRGLWIAAGKWGAINLRKNILTGNTHGSVIWARSLEAQDNYIMDTGSSQAPGEGHGLIVLATEKIDLVGNTVIANKGSGLILGLSQSGEMKIERNLILHNDGYGLALLNPDCAYVTGLLELIIPETEWEEIEDKFYEGQLQGEVRGSDNFIFGNKEGDLCPSDYPWPAGFVKRP